MSRVRSVLIALLLFLVAFASPRPAQAQGTSGQLPDPMPTTELNDLLKRYVKPDPAQMATIETLHDDYRTQFRELRESEIEKFLKEMQALGGGGVPSKAAVLEFTRKYDRITTKIAELDDNLFDAIATLMGDERRPDVKRAKDARARARAATGMMGQFPGMGGRSVDVSRLVMESGLPPTELAALQPELVSYEERLTSLSKEIGSAGTKMMLEMVDALEKANLGNVSEQDLAADPERMQQMMQVVQEAMAKAYKPMAEKSANISELHAKTFRSMHARMSGEAARKLRVRFLGTAYPEIGGDPAGVEALFRAALRVKAIDEGVKSQINEAYRSWQASDDALVDQAAKQVDANRAKINPMDFGAMNEGQQALTEVVTKRGELGQKSLETLKSLVGEDRLGKLIGRRIAANDMFDETGDPEAAEAGEGEEPGIGMHASAPEEIAMGMDTGEVEQSLDVGSVQGLVARLDLDPGMKAAVETMHSDYLKKWTDEIEPLRAKIAEAQSGIWSWDQNTGRATISAEKRDAYHALRKEAMNKVLEIDDAFFHDVANVVGDAKAADIALARLDRLMAGPRSSASMPRNIFGESEQPVNVIRILRDADVSADDRSKIMAALAPRVAELSQLLRTLRVEQMEGDREMQALQEASTQSYTEGETPDPVEAQKMGQRWMELQKRLDQIGQKRSDAVSGAWMSAIDGLDAAAKDSLQLAYERQAFPSIFRDPRCALPYFEKANDLGDLSDAQRTEISALQKRYSDEYTGHCRKMVPKREVVPAPDDENSNRDFWQRRMAEENERAKIRFERDERSQRAVSQLRRILTPDQVKRLPGLERYGETHEDAGIGFPVRD